MRSKTRQKATLNVCFLARFTLSIGTKVNFTLMFMTNFDDFSFYIKNFPLLSSKIPYLPAYGVFMSHPIRYARTCSPHGCFISRATQPSILPLLRITSKNARNSQSSFFYRFGDLIKQHAVPLS